MDKMDNTSINNNIKRTEVDQKSLLPNKDNPGHPAPAEINED